MTIGTLTGHVKDARNEQAHESHPVSVPELLERWLDAMAQARSNLEPSGPIPQLAGRSIIPNQPGVLLTGEPVH